ncbi:serine hydrolase [bacterium]|nr:serine hydrolase [bacterium]
MTKKSRKSVPTRTTLWVEALEQREVPAVAIAGGPYTIAEGQNLVLNASGSSNVGGGPLAYTWDVDGDGIYGDAIGVSPTVDWPLLNRLGVNDGPSSFNVRVRVNDTTFSPTAVNTLSNSYYQQNRIVLRGLGVIVGQGDRILFENYYGNYNANTQENIASGSKLVTSVTMMRLVNQGLMSLDAPISTYLPDLTWNPSAKSTMTLRQLLSHTSGLTGNDVNAVENAASLQAGAPLIASSLIALQAPPGTEFDYGSNGYRLAAAAAERVTGLSWASIVNQYTAVPLGMSISWNGGANTNPAGQSRLTAKSYSNMLQMLMNQGVYNGQQFLSNGLVEEITTIQPGSTNVHPGSFYQSTALGYGFGQWIQGVDPNGRATVLSHFGSNGFKGAWDRTRGLWYVALLRDANSLTDSAGFFVNLINQVNSQIDPVDVDSPPVTLSVANALPTAGISVASAAVRGESLNFTFTATDPSPIDRAANFTYQVDWNNDGVIDLTQTGGNNFNVSYAYTQVGSFTPSVRVTDKDGGVSASVSQSVNITRSRTTSNPNNPSLTDLFIGGSSGDDFIIAGAGSLYDPLAGPNSVFYVNFNSTDPIEFFPNITGRLVVYLQSGNDVFNTANLNRPELVFGGDGADTIFGSSLSDTINGGDGDDIIIGSIDPSTAGDLLNADGGSDIVIGSDGNDTINGGEGNDVLIGSEGNDLITGGSGDDFIVGMAGADTIFGGTGSDLLIAGVLLDDPEESVDGIVLEWWSGDTYTNRVGRLRGTQGGGQNAYPLTVNDNVLDDQAVDQLYGEADLDLFYFDVASDIAPDVAPGEVAIDL